MEVQKKDLEVVMQKPGTVSLNEFALWQDFKSGNMEAYAVVYSKYFFLLYSYGKKVCDDHELVKDCIQDLFIKIWNNRENLGDTNSIKYYLFTSLKRKLLDTLATPHIRFSSTTDLFNEDIQELIAEESGDDIGSEDKAKVLKALTKLSRHQQKLLNMKFYRNLSNQEISEEMGITLQSVYNAVFKALRSLRSQLSITFLLLLNFFG